MSQQKWIHNESKKVKVDSSRNRLAWLSPDLQRYQANEEECESYIAD